MSAVVAPTLALNNGREIPVLGLGTWLMESKGAVDFIKAAIDVGYRHFDTALVYHSEGFIGEAFRDKIADGTVTREELFITTKLWCTDAHPGMIVDACKKSLKNLGLDYIDLYLIHWPMSFKPPENSAVLNLGDIADPKVLLESSYFPKDSSGKVFIVDNDYVNTWKEMEQCVKLGLTKSIGLSNFNSKQIDRILEVASIKPVTNQVEVHPYLNQKKLIDFCRERDILITCYGPLGANRPVKDTNLPPQMEHPTIVKISEAKGKTPAQVSLRYLIQRGLIVIPKTSNPKRLVENISVFDFSLTPEEMEEIDSMNCNGRLYTIPGTEHHKYYPFHAEF